MWCHMIFFGWHMCMYIMVPCVVLVRALTKNWHEFDFPWLSILVNQIFSSHTIWPVLNIANFNLSQFIELDVSDMHLAFLCVCCNIYTYTSKAWLNLWRYGKNTGVGDSEVITLTLVALKDAKQFQRAY